MLRFANFELDRQRAELRGPDGVPVKLRRKSFEMLGFLAENAGRIVSKQELLETVWPNVHVGDGSLYQCSLEIRTALGDNDRQIIKVVPSRGYLFAAEVSTEPAQTRIRIAEEASSQGLELQQADAAEIDHTPLNHRVRFFALHGRTVRWGLAGLAVIIAVAAAIPVFWSSFFPEKMRPSLTVMPILNSSNDEEGEKIAAGVTKGLTDGFAKIGNIQVLALTDKNSPRSEQSLPVQQRPDFVVRGELRQSAQAWTLQTRLINTATGEVQSVDAASVDTEETDLQLQQTRLAAGAGHQLAQRLNRMLEPQASNSVPDVSSTGDAKVAIEQALTSINRTTRERFGIAQEMLEKALVAAPRNNDLAVALSALQLRGIQMDWFSPTEKSAVETQAAKTLERALQIAPNSAQVLEAHCRLLSATNQFVESIVTCAKALSFDPWNGSALYLVGLSQIFLGQFDEALATFKQADRFDSPRVSRWTWLLGAGWAYAMMERYEDAVPWLQRSIAITPASGRSDMLLAAVYYKIGRTAEARATMQKGLALRPGTTALNMAPPTENTTPTYLESAQRLIRLMVQAGLPES